MKPRIMHVNFFDFWGFGKTTSVVVLALLLSNLFLIDLAETAELMAPKISGGDTLKKKNRPQRIFRPVNFRGKCQGDFLSMIFSLDQLLLKTRVGNFLVTAGTFNAGLFGDRLILMVRFYYKASTSDTPLKFVIKLPDSRQYEETVRLSNNQGQFAYHFTIHRPEDFLGSGMIYVYYGFSIVDVLDFTIMPGA